MSDYLKVKDSPYIRDTKSKAILNTDKDALREYQMKKSIAEKQNKESTELKNRVLNIENQMQEIKQMLMRLLNNAN